MAGSNRRLHLQSAEHADANLRGLREAGIRGYFLYGGPGPASQDANPPHPADARRMRDQNFASGANGRLRMGMALRGPCFTTAERNAADFAFARDLGLPISVHVGMAGTSGAVTTLRDFGLLGTDVNYAHGNMLTGEEFDLIAGSGGTLSISPSSDMLMQFGTVDLHQRDMLRLATADGARVWNLGAETGSLTVGKIGRAHV